MIPSARTTTTFIRIYMLHDMTEMILQLVNAFFFNHPLQERKTRHSEANTVKALLSPWGAYLISDLPEGHLIERGLIRKGRLIHKIK